MYQFIYFLKTVAALFITNSHFDKLYPVAALSIGGGIGNTIFFLISGFCLSSKISKKFGEWMLSRIKRLYPSLWIVTVCCIFFGRIHPRKMIEWIMIFLLPFKTYWFIAAILIFYILFYFIVKYKPNIHFMCMFLIVIYFLFYFTTRDLNHWSIENADYFKYIYYFSVMYVGYILKIKFTYIKNRIQTINRLYLVFLTLSTLFAYFAFKLIMTLDARLYYFQFVAQLLMLLFALFAFISSWKFEKEISSSHFIKGFQMIGNSTLEIYLLNYIFSDIFVSTPFPVSVAGALVLILISGCTLHYAIKKPANKKSRLN